jgi:hypothetical protein
MKNIAARSHKTARAPEMCHHTSEISRGIDVFTYVQDIILGGATDGKHLLPRRMIRGIYIRHLGGSCETDILQKKQEY